MRILLILMLVPFLGCGQSKEKDELDKVIETAKAFTEAYYQGNYEEAKKYANDYDVKKLRIFNESSAMKLCEDGPEYCAEIVDFNFNYLYHETLTKGWFKWYKLGYSLSDSTYLTMELINSEENQSEWLVSRFIKYSKELDNTKPKSEIKKIKRIIHQNN